MSNATATTPSIQSVIAELNDTVKSTFGTNHSASIARCPAFGHDDCCVIISGPSSAKAAQLFATKTPNPTISHNESEFRGHTSTTSTIEWAA